MNQIKQDPSFLGIGWSFPPAFRRELNGVEMVTGDENVKKSIEIILTTLPGERIMQPSFGCNLHTHVFEEMTVQNIALIQRIVFEALTFHEPRIIVDEITSQFYPESGLLEITIPYTIIRTNTRYNYVFPYYMKEATNIEHL